MTGGALQLQGLTKAYAGTPAVRGIDLEVRAGEFFCLLGPSGCGKTTTLRMVGGFERPDAGRILLDGADLAAVAPHRRPVNTVFQSYALFPFLDVRDNVAFGLRYQRCTKAEVRQRVGEALELVDMTAHAGRRPGQLSGGQQQRVALARALVLGPRVLLLDEPLGALDAQLRARLQEQLKAVQERVGITFVHVTHDQDEAMAMSDRLALMADGRVEQVGPPAEVYARPRSAWVAGFLGSANVLDVEVLGTVRAGVAECRSGATVLRAEAEPGSPARGAGKVVVRPERVRLGPVAAAGAAGAAADDATCVTGLVDRTVYLGPSTSVVVRLADGQQLLVAVPNTSADLPAWCTAGSPVRASFPPDAARLLPSGAGAAEQGSAVDASPDLVRLPDQRASAASG